jgi:hypothetical protein
MRTLTLCLTIVLTAAGSADGADVMTPLEIGSAQQLYVAKCAKRHRPWHGQAAATWKCWSQDYKAPVGVWDSEFVEVGFA